jgi:hypothetical protein
MTLLRSLRPVPIPLPNTKPRPPATAAEASEASAKAGSAGITAEMAKEKATPISAATARTRLVLVRSAMGRSHQERSGSEPEASPVVVKTGFRKPASHAKK